MNASDTTARNGQESSGTDTDRDDSTGPSRRTLLADLVTAQREAHDEPDPEEWGPIGTSIYTVNEVAVDSLSSVVAGPVGHAAVEPMYVDESTVCVDYTSQYIQVSVTGTGDFEELSAGFTLDTERARALAVALFQAAEEKDSRPSSEASDD